LDADCLYRGHWYRKRFCILWPPWVTQVAVPPRNPSHASITVDGEGEKSGHIMFVFDCSGSMEAGGRIGTAKDSLKQVLESLLAAKRYDVGLRAYGRRATFTNPSDCSAKQWIDGLRPEQRVHPDLDVELMLPLQVLDNVQYRAILSKYPLLKPWGFTPLYLALKKAFDDGDFAHVTADEPKRLIVITDGVNNQTPCLNKDIPTESPTLPVDVLNARRDAGSARDVQIDIVGLDLGDDSADQDKRKRQELIDLARATGGRYFDASDTRTLVKALRDALKLVEYTVDGPGASDDGKTACELGETWRLPNLPVLPASYDIRLLQLENPPTATVRIEGGEALLLRYDQGRNRLFYPPYVPNQFDAGDAFRGKPQDCSDPGGSGTYTVQTLLPRRIAKDVEFYLSVQQTDHQRFTYRPKHVWAEVRPLGADAGRVYYFADTDFVPDRPVPVFRFLAKSWPETAEEAEIRVWFKFDPDAAKPCWTGAVDPTHASQFDVPEMPGVEFEIETKSPGGGATSVIVTERHPMDQPIAAARVRIYPAPDELIQHEYAGLVNVVKHEFRYNKPTPARVDITSKDTIIENAITVPPMRVVVEQ
ncbi:MAG: VWA domain-containing protein, partial [Planctomycetes bacterium]|nr:VWA domain-containing protein [Planctomycetota bacterium]